MMNEKKCCSKGALHGRLKGCGYRMTLARQAVMDVLSDSKEHLSAEEIFNLARKKNPDIGLTTIYRTTEILSSQGFLHKFDFGDKRARFELADSSKGHHHHLVCTVCNKIIDYDDFIDEEVKLLNETQAKLGKKYNFKIENHLIQFYGKCAQCAGGE
ncbi:MAG TPA: transcriptional repressor [Candidatus Goldiibacteriota bacterium]|nr:transcriptional repressor [Candidatus Goldiibacteriota bacterium]HPN65557.1 transcriptional repressor [Candidatus Goldiibacteriota bacterium]HRQ45243.1 transcriptional repressor [Candidatus Goldiibacteriota bacterium]